MQSESMCRGDSEKHLRGRVIKSQRNIGSFSWRQEMVDCYCASYRLEETWVVVKRLCFKVRLESLKSGFPLIAA